MLVPQLILRQLYTNGSLQTTENGIRFSIKNRLADAKILSVNEICIDKINIDLNNVKIAFENGQEFSIDEIKAKPIDFPLRKLFYVKIDNLELSEEKH